MKLTNIVRPAPPFLWQNSSTSTSLCSTKVSHSETRAGQHAILFAMFTGQAQLEKLDPTRTAIGQISFTNVLPLVLPLVRKTISYEADWLFANPEELNQMLAKKKLDVSAMSAFHFLQSRDFELIPGVSISSRGPVGSVLFFSRVPPGELHNKPIEVTNASATSIRLLSILLEESYGVTPRLVSSASPSIGNSEDQSYGALVIGDQALKLDQDWSSLYLRFDLGGWWFEQFALPMVFGVWGARKSWLEHHQKDFVDLSVALVEAKKLGLTSLLDAVIEEAGRKTGLNSQRLRSYFTQQLDFDLTEEHLSGLRLYEQLCKKHGLLTS